MFDIRTFLAHLRLLSAEIDGCQLGSSQMDHLYILERIHDRYKIDDGIWGKDRIVSSSSMSKVDPNQPCVTLAKDQISPICIPLGLG